MRLGSFILVACVGLAQVAGAAYIEVAFRPQNGTPDVATEWAVEMISDTPIGSTGIFIPDGPDLTSFTSWNAGATPVVGFPGVMATIHAVEDPTDPWEYVLRPQPVPFPPTMPGRIINATAGSLATALGPVNTWLGLGVLHDVSQMAFVYGEGEETDLWIDSLGNPIPASDVDYTFPEPSALLLLSLGLTALALLRGRGRV